MNKQRDALWKWVIIGNSGVGKTSILSRLCSDEFNNTFISTIGIDFKIKKMEFGGRNITIQIWDTAGQERFATITKSCYRGAIGIILAYDVTSLASFNDVGKWIKDIQIHSGDDVHKILVGNKCDMESSRVISTAEGQAMADRNGLSFMEVSAKTSKNIEKAFTTLAEQILGLGQAIISNSPTTTTATTTPLDKNKGLDSISTVASTNDDKSSSRTSSSLFGWFSGSSSSSTGNSSGTTSTISGGTTSKSEIVNNSHPSDSKMNPPTITSNTLQNNHHQRSLEANVDSDIIRLAHSPSSSPTIPNSLSHKSNEANTHNFNNNQIRLRQDDSNSGKATKSRCCS